MCLNFWMPCGHYSQMLDKELDSINGILDRSSRCDDGRTGRTLQPLTEKSWEYERCDSPGQSVQRARLYPNLEARAVTFHVFRISEHTRNTHVLFVLAPVYFPSCHVIKSSGKLFASNPLHDLFAPVTDNFNCLDSRERRGFDGHARFPFLSTEEQAVCPSILDIIGRCCHFSPRFEG